MGTGASVLLIVLGTVLRYAVTSDVAGIEPATVGVILMGVGILGLAVVVSWSPVRTRS